MRSPRFVALRICRVKNRHLMAMVEIVEIHFRTPVGKRERIWSLSRARAYRSIVRAIHSCTMFLRQTLMIQPLPRLESAASEDHRSWPVMRRAPGPAMAAHCGQANGICCACSTAPRSDTMLNGLATTIASGSLVVTSGPLAVTKTTGIA